MTKTTTFGDARKIILETIIELKAGTMDVSRGMAVAANMKVLNDSIQVEINAAKLSLQAVSAGKDFGDIMRLGTRPVFDGQLLIE
jgi:hypothetical protein